MRVFLRIAGGLLFVRQHRLFDVHDGVRRLLHALVLAAAHHRQHRPAERGPLLRLGDVYGHIHHVRHDLPPQRALGAAAAQLGAGDGRAVLFGGFQTVAQGKGHPFQHRQRQLFAGGIGAHADEGAARGHVVVGAALAHQVGEEEHVVLAEQRFQPVLFGGVVGGIEYLIRPPGVAAGRRKDAAHQVPAAVGMAEAVQGVHLVLFILRGGDEQRAAGAEGDIAPALAHDARAHGSRGVVAGARHDLHARAEAQRFGDLALQRAHHLVAFVQGGELFFADAAHGAHLAAPAAVFHVQQQHARSIRKIGAEGARKAVCQIVFGQHDLGDPGKVFRLVVAHPQNFGGGEAGKGDVARPLRQLVFAHRLVQVRRLRFGAAVVPEDGGADDVVVFIQRHQPVHLPAEGDAFYGGLVLPVQQGGDARQRRRVPVFGALFAPARLRVVHGVTLGVLRQNGAVRRHQQEFCPAGAQVDADVTVHLSSSRFSAGARPCGGAPAFLFF